MSKYDKAAARMAMILNILSEGRRPTLDELAEEFNVSTRTIRRDIDERLMLFPIERDTQGCYRFQEGYSLDKSVLERDEMLHVMLALSQITNASESFKRLQHSIISKLAVPGLKSPYYIKPELFEPFDTDSPTANRIEEAIMNARGITFTYKGRMHSVAPYRITSFDGLWYLFARDIISNKTRTYQAAYIGDVELTQQYFEHTDIDTVLDHVHTAWFEDGNCFEVSVRVEAEIADYFRRKKHLSTQRVKEELEDGSLLVTFEVSSDEDIDNLIKAWLPHIEILTPQRLRLKILKELKSYVASLETSPVISV